MKALVKPEAKDKLRIGNYFAMRWTRASSTKSEQQLMAILPLEIIALKIKLLRLWADGPHLANQECQPKIHLQNNTR